MKYQSKKDPSIYAAFDFEDPKFHTTRMIYLTGDNKGKSFEVTNSTLKRWWRKVAEEDVTSEVKEEPKQVDENPLNIDYDKVNEPYKPDVTPHYIPKPQSVIEYEQSKSKKAKLDFELPKDYEEFADLLSQHNVHMARVNSGYISMTDKSKLKLLTKGIGVLASSDLGIELAKHGMTSKPCVEKGTPFRFDVTTEANFNDLLVVLEQLYPN